MREIIVMLSIVSSPDEYKHAKTIKVHNGPVAPTSLCLLYYYITK
jgi:hypothetical protein